LHPRIDRFCQLLNFSALVQPQPQGSWDLVDLDGNNLIKLWFATPTEQLNIQVLSQVETTCVNPFSYLLEPWATTLPLDYPHSLFQQLESYLRSLDWIADPSAVALAQELALDTEYNTLNFLFALNQRIYRDCEYITRETGQPLPAGITWRRKQGSCRDYTVLFMEVCRAVGIAARFVSGYQEGDTEQENRDLHAWAEVYLPGAGWRGYDPTLGLVVSDRHIPLAASAIPSYTAPVDGSVTPVRYGEEVIAKLNTQISIIRF
jgi:transglutaminase-like putative cysteine protease